MKLKSDFITNSSSASFIMRLRTEEQMEPDEFKEKFDEYLTYFQKNNPDSNMRYWDGTNITPFGDGYLFDVSEWTSMYNGNEDIPNFMKELMVQKFNKDRDFGFEIISFEVDDDY